MAEEIKVYVISKNRKNLYLRYIDPLTGKPVEKSAGTGKRSLAVKAAGKWEAELREGRYQKPNKVTWEALRERYTSAVLPGLATATTITYEATWNVFERLCNPHKLASVTTSTISTFVMKLRDEGLSDATIARHLRALRVITRWAHGEGMLASVPKFSMPPRAKGSKKAKGRAPTAEEFERMLSVVPKVVENVAAPSWQFYLRGLWLSGLRLSESLTLRWDDALDAIVVELGGRRPFFRIPAEVEKGNQDRLLPMTPDFAAFLLAVPECERRGTVFKLLGADCKPIARTRCLVGKILSEVGKAAGVVVKEQKKAGDVKRKFASAHDLRRAFGFRWAMRVMPTVLKELMRHEDVNTTMEYYVVQNAEAIADAVWAAAGDTLVDTTGQPNNTVSKNTLNSSGDDRS